MNEVKLTSHNIDIDLDNWILCSCKEDWQNYITFKITLAPEIHKDEVFPILKDLQNMDDWNTGEEYEYEITIRRKKL